MYTDYYGLTERPFQLTPDARFWFESRTHKKAMAYLGYGLAQGEGFITITGDIGAGKSTLVAHLLATIDRERLNAIHIASTQVDGDDLLRLVAQGLGIATGGIEKARLIDAVEQKLDEEARRGRRTLIVVDEAQNLSVAALEELRMLSNCTREGRALVQTLLLGQPEFRDRVASDPGLEQLRQRVIASHHLEPIEANEVEPYLVHRLACVGWQGRPAFDAGAFAALYLHSGGVPRRLNQLANRLLLQGAIEQADRFESGDVERVVADLAADAPQPSPARPAAQAERAAPTAVRDLGLERRLAALEARVDEQEIIVRRVLTLLVEWVENGQQAPGYTNAA
ncbi:MAG TPA: AAA family ATPase [Allosphingosinicella sp.]|jgi:putative secretion ATPase (PEP-CTERM system associated)|nr:AAA family ATPase [Allosphingosinicella sp.]